ncbi:MAG: hypothetical protein AAF532_16180 [Planctomycetota bacterium]
MTTRDTRNDRFAARRIEAAGRNDRAVVRRLTAADGYLELDMTDAALRELAAIEDAGHYGAAVDLLTGRVLMARGQYEAAVIPLREAAEALPTPFDRCVWAELEVCFRAGGEHVLADVAAEFAVTSGLPESLDEAADADPGRPVARDEQLACAEEVDIATKTGPTHCR